MRKGSIVNKYSIKEFGIKIISIKEQIGVEIAAF
jgi:hypothetical protein